MVRILILLCLASPALAQTPMTAAEFEAYVTGKTLSFGTAGAPYGMEWYRSDRRVTWAFTGEDCQDGIWYEEAGNICFDYNDDLAPQCWRFFDEAGGLRAEFMNEPGTTILYEALDTQEQLICPNMAS